MSKIIYDIYSVSIKDKSKKQVNKLLKNESASYAYIGKKHISFFASSGTSLADYVIDIANKESFVFICKHDSGKLYLLIYQNQEISYSGLLFESEIHEKLSLYQNILGNETTVYCHDCAVEIKFDHLPQELPEEFDLSDISKRYQLKSAAQILSSKQTFRKILTRTLSVAVIVIASTAYYFHYQKQIELERQAKAEKKVVDIWKPYRQAMQFPYPSMEINNFNKELNILRKLPQCSISNFTYQSGSISAQMANFGYPIQRLLNWAQQSDVNVSDIDTAGFKASLYKSTKNEDRGNQIMSVQAVQYWVMDYISNIFDGSNYNLSFNDNSSSGSIFTSKTFSLNLTNFPLKTLASRFVAFNKYPIKLSEITGSVTLGQFNGSITFKIIGE